VVVVVVGSVELGPDAPAVDAGVQPDQAPVAEVHFVAETGTSEAAGRYFAAGSCSAAGRYSAAGSCSAVGRCFAAGTGFAPGTGFAVYFYLTAVVLTLLIFSPLVLQLSWLVTVEEL